ncbi:MAG: GTP cyclohydrolase, FolE2/MptA family, partial [Phycisphaerae bacterium]|nr:GTP cyclohydrolase, FolE2/MptA family [Phycisphaerae bacterium]
MTTMTTQTGSSTKGLTDVQASPDQRNIPIDKVGVKDVTYPIKLRTPEGGEQHTVAQVNMYVS